MTLNNSLKFKQLVELLSIPVGRFPSTGIRIITIKHDLQVGDLIYCLGWYVLSEPKEIPAKEKTYPWHVVAYIPIQKTAAWISKGNEVISHGLGGEILYTVTPIQVGI